MTPPISKQTLCSFLFDQGYSDSEAYDEFYALLDRSWLQNEFAAALYLAQMRDKLTDYVQGKWNCNKFSLHAQVVADVCYLRTRTDDSEPTALAFGRFNYVKAEDGGGECINVAVTRDSQMNLGLVWFQAQNRTLVTPNIKEGTQCTIRL